MRTTRNKAISAARIIAPALAALGAAVAVPAHAQDDPSTDQGPRYNGVYVAAGVGATMQPNDGRDTLIFSRGGGPYGNALPNAAGGNAFAPGYCGGAFTSSAPGNCVLDKNRPDYSVKIGLDSRSGMFVAGVLVEGQFNHSKDYTSGFSTTPAAYQITRGIDYGISARGRVGISPDEGGGLMYLTAGVGYARMRHQFLTTNTVNQFTPVNSNSWQLGGQFGGGAEVMMTPHVGLGIEYLYNHYRDRKYYVQVSQGTAAATNPFIIGGTTTNIKDSNPNYNFHTVRAVLAYHF